MSVDRIVQQLAAMLTADSQAQRIDARNALQDELDAIEDLKRGAGEIAAQPLETIA